MTLTPDPFEKIAADAVREAERVKCPFSVFVEGLRTIGSEIRERLRTAEDELHAMRNKDPNA